MKIASCIVSYRNYHLHFKMHPLSRHITALSKMRPIATHKVACLVCVLSVCCHDRDPLKIIELIKMPFWVWLVGPKGPCIRWGSRSHPWKGALLRETLEVTVKGAVHTMQPAHHHFCVFLLLLLVITDWSNSSNNIQTHTHTRLTAHFSGTTRVSRY